MSDKKRKVPKLRFPGFTDAWEQRKLGDIASMHARIGWQNLRTSEFLDSGEYMLITGTDFSNGGIDYSGVHYVEKDRYDQDSKIQLDSESILITKDGTIGKVAYVSDLPMPATLNAGVFNVRVKDRNHFDSYYLFQYLKAPFLLDYVRKTSTGGTILHLNQNVLVNFPIYYGSKSEQKAVGEYLKNFDSLISLHQRKLDNIKMLKKSLLQKLFPKDGEKIPELRFPGFTDAWEQRKLGEVVFRRNAAEVTGALPGVEYEDVIPEEGRLNKNVSLKEVTKKGLEFLEGDVLFGKLRPYLKNWLFAEFNGVAVGDWWVLYSDKVDGRLIYYLIQTDSYQTVANLSTGTKMPRSDWTTVSQTIFAFPVSADEQLKIGKYFSSIDSLISLHQRKLDHLKELKKGLLQQMFV